MKKKILLSIFFLLFFGISIMLSLGIFLFGESQAGSNESLSSAPALRAENGALNTNYLAELSQWVDDRFFLRQEMITLDNLITSAFGVSGEESVILGEVGWLFFEPTLKDYTGTSLLSQRELFSVFKNIQLMNEYCQQNGKEFCFVIAPNKNSLYGEYMPDLGIAAQERDSQKLMEMLKAAGVKTPDLFTAVASKYEQLYFRHDSHWNSKGAALCADTINGVFDVESDFYNGDFSTARSNSGDLYGMLYPALSDRETDWILSGDRNFVFTGSGQSPTSFTITTESRREGRLLAYRDSFGNLLFPYLAESYGQCLFSRKTVYDLTLDADYVMVELAERNLSYLLTYTPLCPSPLREIDLPAVSSGAVTIQHGNSATAPEGTAAIRGCLPACDSNSAVYVTANGKTYEAFLTGDNGFCAYIPEDGTAESVVCYVDGQPVKYDF